MIGNYLHKENRRFARGSREKQAIISRACLLRGKED
jgi:hypothetical protein